MVDLSLIPAFAVDIFRGQTLPVTKKFVLWWFPCQVPGIIGSVLGLVGPVSVCCEWVRFE